MKSKQGEKGVRQPETLSLSCLFALSVCLSVCLTDCPLSYEPATISIGKVAGEFVRLAMLSEIREHERAIYTQ